MSVVRLFSQLFLLVPTALVATQLAPATAQESTAEVSRDVAGLLELEEKVASVKDRIIAASVGLQFRSGHASGVIVSKEGHVLTVAHALDRPHRRLRVVLSDGRRVNAETLGRNGRGDFGMVKITEEGEWPFCEIGTSSDLAIHEPLLGTGHPDSISRTRGPVLRFGTVNRTSSMWIRSSCAIMPGDSGGPVFDLDGRVVGISSWIEASLDGNHAVPIERFIENWDRLEEGDAWDLEEEHDGRTSFARAPHSAKFGFEGQDIDTQFQVTHILPGGAAEASGLRVDDVVTAIAGEPVRSRRRANRLLRRRTRPFDLSVRRGDEELELRLDPAVSKTSVYPWRGDRTLRSTADEIAKSFTDAVVELRGRQNGALRRIAGTVIDESGLVLTKASELGSGEIACVLSNGDIIPSDLLGVDQDTDLALIKVPRTGLTSVTLDTKHEPARGNWLVSPSPDGVQVGVVSTVPYRVRGSNRAYLGVRLAEFEGQGAQIEWVEEGTAAEGAGLEGGDIIHAVDDTTVADREDLIRVLGRMSPGDDVVLSVVREEESLEIEATLGRRTNRSRRGERHVADTIETSDRSNAFPLVLRHDSDVLPEDCGGPVIDSAGRCVGINIARADRIGTLAVPAALAREIADRLLAERESKTEESD